MDSQNVVTNGWNSSSASTLTKIRKNWAFYLPLAEFAHNSWRNESTGQTPFEVLMGYSPRAEWTTTPSPIPQVTLRLDQFKRAREQAQRLMRKAQQGWEKHKREGRIFQEGDQVWLEGTPHQNTSANGKTGRKAPRTLQSHEGPITPELPTGATGAMADPRCVPCGPSDALS
jgi:hypothetical protein